MNLQTIQKVAQDKGIHPDSVLKMIKDGRILAYKQDGFKRVMIDLNEFNSSFKAINNVCEEFDISIFEI